MGKLAVNTTMLTVALTASFGLVAFFSQEWFGRVTATARAFEEHKGLQEAVIAKLESHDSLLEQKYGQVESRLEKMDLKLDRLLERR